MLETENRGRCRSFAKKEPATAVARGSKPAPVLAVLGYRKDFAKQNPQDLLEIRI
jgi:hypothetical protein